MRRHPRWAEDDETGPMDVRAVRASVAAPGGTIACFRCEGRVPELANRCRHCGQPLDHRRNDLDRGPFAGLSAMIVGTAWFCLGHAVGRIYLQALALVIVGCSVLVRESLRWPRARRG
jgi:hypothetical protein